jgi:hypothetical protein
MTNLYKLRIIWWKFRWAIRNLIIYFKPVIKQRDYDWKFILHMMKFQLSLLRKSIEKGYTIQKDKKKTLTQIDQVIRIMTNIEESNYLDRSKDFKNKHKVAIHLEENEWNLMMSLLKNHMREWWD